MDTNEEDYLHRSRRQDSELGDGGETGTGPHDHLTNDLSMETIQTRPKGTECDGVGVIAILRDPKAGPSLLLQKQFRPPLDKVTIEVRWSVQTKT